MGHEGNKSIKTRVAEELKAFWVIAIYLWVVLGSFVVYRRLISDEMGVPYVNFGFALIESLIIAKVMLIGRMFGVSRRFEDRPLIVPVIYKTLLFGLLVLAFSVVEKLVEGWIHHRGLLGGLREFTDIGFYEIGARALMLVAAFVPFFAFAEIGRVLGPTKLRAMFFSRGAARPAPEGV